MHHHNKPTDNGLEIVTWQTEAVPMPYNIITSCMYGYVYIPYFIIDIEVYTCLVNPALLWHGNGLSIASLL